MQVAKLSALPLPQRMLAMEVLWSSMSQDAHAQDLVPDWHKKTVLARVKALRAGAEVTASLEQTKKNIQKRIAAAKR
jgi:Putative addiction module component